ECDTVETDGKLTRTGGGHGSGAVVDDKARRHREGQAQARMQEGVAAHIAFFRRVAVKQAVYARKEGVAIARALPRRAELARMALRELDALRRVGVACEKVEAGVGRAADRAEIGIGRHRLQEAARRVR